MIKKFLSNHKYAIGIITGVILASTICSAVTAAIVISAGSVSYNDKAGIGATNIQEAIDKLNTKATTKISEAKKECPSGYKCTKTVWTNISGGSNQTIGNLIKVDSEEFYVISNDGTNIKALAKNNLAGSIQDSSNEINPIAFNIEGGGVNWAGNADFSSELFSSSSINTYLTEYKRILNKTMNANVTDVTLISSDDLSSLGCETSNNYSCDGAPSFLTTTNYWTRYVTFSQVLAISTDSVELIDNTDGSTYGVRPVITIPVSLF